MTVWLAAEYGTVSDIEIAWTMLALFGGVLSVANVRDAFADLQATGHLRVDNGRRVIAETGMRVELARLAIQSIFALIGLLAMLIPDPPPVAALPWTIAATGIAVRWGLILAAALVTYQSIENRRLRQTLRADVASLQPPEPGGTP